MTEKNTCNTITDSQKCYDTDQEVADYGKTFKEQVDESKGPSQEEVSLEIFGDKTEQDYDELTKTKQPE